MSRLRQRPDQGYGYISRAFENNQLLDTARQVTYFAELCQQYQLRPLLEGLNEYSALENTFKTSQLGGQDGQRATQCLSSLRKLREGIISKRRFDDFAVKVFETTVRYAILHDHMETYFPAMQYLQTTLYLRQPPSSMLRDNRGQAKIGELLALHLCSINEYHEALEIGQATKSLGGRDVVEIVKTLTHGNWRKLERLRNDADLLTVRLFDKIAKNLSRSTLACIGAAYLAVDAAWLCECCGEQWKTEIHERGWQVDHARVLLKTPKSPKG